MSLGLFAPLFLAGAGLLALPYLIHRIRRPERKPVAFSSLMFVPEVKLETIERRRVQHILLMLLRMACLLLLCFAFSRPYQREPLAAGASPEGVGHHVILLDRSFSLAADGRFEAALEKARAIVAGLPAGDRAGVIAFDDRTEVLAPLHAADDPEAGSAARARDGLGAARLTARGTDFLGAMQAAEAMLQGASEGREAEAIGRTVHVVSDFQRSGMPAGSDWRLPASIAVEAVAVGAPASNVAVEELAVQESEEGPLRVRARIRNWGAEAATVAASLEAEGVTAESQSLTVEPGSAMQAVFAVARPERGGVRGAVRVTPGGALGLDDLRYFAWNPRDPQRALLAGRTGEATRLSGADFIRLALEGASRDLAVELAAPETLAATMGKRMPGLVVLTDTSSMDGATLGALTAYIRGGGSALIVLEAAEEVGDEAAAFLRGLGAEPGALRFEEIREGRFDLLASIKLDHPVFAPFRGAQYNDFSSLRFQNYRVITGGEGTTALAAFEGADREEAAILEGTLGAGRWIVWTFSLDPAWSNVAKSPRFVPLLLETVAYLAPPAEAWRPIGVGEPLAAAPENAERWQAAMPGAAGAAPLTSRPSADTAGLARVFDGESERFVAVNVAGGESDLTAVDGAEFSIRLASAPIPVAPSSAGAESAGAGPSESVVDYEYGRWLIAALAAFLAVESLYAARLSGARTQESAP